MANQKNPFDQFRVRPDAKVKLKDYDPDWVGDGKGKSESDLKAHLQKTLQKDLEDLYKAQELLWASDRYAILVVLQGMDAAGKDGLIKHVMSGLNPQGCQVVGFKQPTHEELDHDFLWRCQKALPERGRIGIFNRSYYEEVLVVKVHPEWLTHQQLPVEKVDRKFWEGRYESINTFEEHLFRNGTRVLKFFLHISKKEQKKRFLERLDDKAKHWKFSASDLAERQYWNDYQKAFEDALTHTSTEHAPWYVVPSNNKWLARAFVAHVLTETIEGLNLQYPEVTGEKMEKLVQARWRLENE